MSEPLRYHGLHIDHPGHHERRAGKKQRVWIGATTAKGTLREIELSADDLLPLIERAAKYAQVMARAEEEMGDA